jgi:hypothetical protein
MELNRNILQIKQEKESEDKQVEIIITGTLALTVVFAATRIGFMMCCGR